MKFYKKYFFIVFLLWLALPLKAERASFQIRIGERVSDFCKRLERQGLWSCLELTKAANGVAWKNYPFIEKKKTGFRRIEGAFRPGNYHFSKKLSLPQVLTRLLDKAKMDYAQKNDSLRTHEPQNQRLSLRQEVILASIVEKEAVANKGYRRVARVFWNRLKKNAPLGSCPTVEYALGYHRPFLLFQDLKFRSRYNVYKYKGLPPSPIAFFSKEALEAVRNPASSKEHKSDFFFVFDWTTKKLHFARDYERHKENAFRARKNFIQKYGRSMMYKKFPNKFYEPID